MKGVDRIPGLSQYLFDLCLNDYSNTIWIVMYSMFHVQCLKSNMAIYKTYIINSSGVKFWKGGNIIFHVSLIKLHKGDIALTIHFL